MPLRFEEKQELTSLSNAFKEVMEARAAIVGLDDVIIKGTGFPNLTAQQAKAAPNAEADLKEMQDALNVAVKSGLIWSNDIEPEITILPQSYINLYSFVQSWEPAISRLGDQEKKQVLAAQADKLANEARTLDAFAVQVLDLQKRIALDGTNFSEKHAAFAELEKLDSESLDATVAALAKVKALIEQEGKTIEIDLSDAEKQLELAKAIMEAGDKVETGTEGDDLAKMVAVTVGVILIAVAEGKIDEALANINERLANAQKEAQYQMNLKALTLQLVALQTAKTAIANLITDVADVHQVFVSTAQWYRDREQDIRDILAAGMPSNEIDEVSMRAYAKAWSDLSIAGRNWQYREIGEPATLKVPIAGFDPALCSP